MPLPKPFKVSVPSFGDGTLLESRVYLATGRNEKARTEQSVAVMAHPYGPLGGSFDDPVVLLVAEELLRAGFCAVVTFNFRRRTSWTSKPELQDYMAVAFFLTRFMQQRGSSKLDMVLAGYSYGSMIASQVPPMQEFLLQNSQADKDLSHLARLAGDLAAKCGLAASSVSPAVTQPVIETRYLLISPVLPPVTLLLTCSLRAKDYTYLKTNPTLAVFGTADNFTSRKKLCKWAEDLQIQSEQVDGAGHFWFELNDEQRLRQAVATWARSGSATQQFEARV